MKEIKLSNTDRICLVDDEDYDLIMSHSKTWCLCAGGKGGASARSCLLSRRREPRRKISMHRLIMNCIDKDNHLDVDHIDRNCLNNQKLNLRLIPHNQNVVNCEKSIKGNTSKYKGVSFHKGARKFQVHVCCEGVRYYGGLFADQISAAKAANQLYLKLIGNVALLNDI